MLFSTGTFDCVTPNEPSSALPLRLSLTADRGRTISRLLLIVPGLLVLLAPASIAAYLLLRDDPALVAERDLFTFAALAAQPALWMLLCGLAVATIVPRLGRRRLVTLTREHVSALETRLTGTSAWRIPTASYRGIAHHVRATAGVVHHEVILVHANPQRSLLLHNAPMVSQADLDHYCNLLRMPLIPSREVYRLRTPGAQRSGFSWLRRLPPGTRDANGLTAGGHAA
mgnify:CR=1 FL=1